MTTPSGIPAIPLGELEAGQPLPVTKGGTGSTTLPTLDQMTAPAANVSLNSHKITSLANGSAASDAAAFGQILSNVATTGTTGYTLVNGTGNIITWTAPNDGALHRFAIFGAIRITSNETGGQITVAYTLPDATAVAHTLFAAGTAAGDLVPSIVYLIPVQANTAVTVKQNTALTGGAAIMWAEIWAS